MLKLFLPVHILLGPLTFDHQKVSGLIPPSPKTPVLGCIRKGMWCRNGLIKVNLFFMCTFCP